MRSSKQISRNGGEAKLTMNMKMKSLNVCYELSSSSALTRVLVLKVRIKFILSSVSKTVRLHHNDVRVNWSSTGVQSESVRPFVRQDGPIQLGSE